MVLHPDGEFFEYKTVMPSKSNVMQMKNKLDVPDITQLNNVAKVMVNQSGALNTTYQAFKQSAYSIDFSKVEQVAEVKLPKYESVFLGPNGQTYNLTASGPESTVTLNLAGNKQMELPRPSKHAFDAIAQAFIDSVDLQAFHEPVASMFSDTKNADVWYRQAMEPLFTYALMTMEPELRSHLIYAMRQVAEAYRSAMKKKNDGLTSAAGSSNATLPFSTFTQRRRLRGLFNKDVKITAVRGSTRGMSRTTGRVMYRLINGRQGLLAYTDENAVIYPFDEDTTLFVDSSKRFATFSSRGIEYKITPIDTAENSALSE